ncbi:MAG: hypothetical protein HZA61_08615 [Candidatus Eisenbacteria bacterium]|uniref:Zinc ribbon domain-containing protein n=1 Tax=Eiseniibacteriota bacterium TaxID=2212470 RepID=A0A933SE02_UNCEI|nr:hypothetical protein [Candidatus Eisenbacteria bacterium]
MASLTCPYCFERYPASSIAYRCINPEPARCAPAPDEALGRYQRLLSPPVLPRVFASPPGMFGRVGKAKCACGMATTKTVCPECHNDLPTQFAEMQSRTIAIIGAKEVGKSHYIAVLIHELETRIGMSFNASLATADETTRTRYLNEFRRFLYVDRVTIPPTASARAGSSVRLPLVYRLSFARDGLFANQVRVIMLVFFDTAGEDLKNIDLMSTETRYIANSDGLIFLLDPLQIPAVRQQVDPGVPLPVEDAPPQHIIERVAQLVRESNRLRPADRLKAPVALAFSKMDAVLPLMDPGAPVRHASNHDGYFDIGGAQSTHASMRSYLHEWIGAGLDQFMRHNFDNYSYFGVSALGAPPDAQGHLPLGVAPFRVEDPFLWILHELGIVPGRKGGSR